MGLSWWRNYLSNRYQLVKLKDAKSNVLPITMGVPQGSSLGPLLFIIYINDLVAHKNILSKNITVYADDTILYTSGVTELDAL